MHVWEQNEEAERTRILFGCPGWTTRPQEGISIGQALDGAGTKPLKIA